MFGAKNCPVHLGPNNLTNAHISLKMSEIPIAHSHSWVCLKMGDTQNPAVNQLLKRPFWDRNASEATYCQILWGMSIPSTHFGVHLGIVVT